MSCKRVTFTKPSGRHVTVKRCDDRKLSESATARYERDGVCREDGRFVAGDSESPEPRQSRAARERAEWEARHRRLESMEASLRARRGRGGGDGGSVGL